MAPRELARHMRPAPDLHVSWNRLLLREGRESLTSRPDNKPGLRQLQFSLHSLEAGAFTIGHKRSTLTLMTERASASITVRR